MTPKTEKIPILLGPTAVGKTATSLALARLLDGEIVNYDARAVYKGLDIGTAKPTPEERAQVPHHLVDVCQPEAAYHVQRFRQDVARLVPQIQARGRVPVLVGGSTLYVEAITVGLFQGPGADPALRARLEQKPSEDLHRRLQEVDPATAACVHPHNRVRVIRALEVFERTGRPISAWQREAKPLPFRFEKFGLTRPRKALYARIDARVEEMVRAGLVEEARRLHPRLNPTLPAYRTITYQELFAHFEGRWSLEAAIAKVKQHTRNYAKRQLTWYRRYDDVRWIEMETLTPEGAARQIAAELGALQR